MPVTCLQIPYLVPSTVQSDQIIDWLSHKTKKNSKSSQKRSSNVGTFGVFAWKSKFGYKNRCQSISPKQMWLIPRAEISGSSEGTVRGENKVYQERGSAIFEWPPRTPRILLQIFTQSRRPSGLLDPHPGPCSPASTRGPLMFGLRVFQLFKCVSW